MSNIMKEIEIEENAVNRAEELCEDILNYYSDFIENYGNPIDGSINTNLTSDVKERMKGYDTETLLENFTNCAIASVFEVTQSIITNTQTFENLDLTMDYYVNALDSHLTLYDKMGHAYSDTNIIDGIKSAFEHNLISAVEETIERQSNYTDFDYDMTMDFISDFLQNDYVSVDDIQTAVYEHQITESLEEGIRAALKDNDLINPNPAITIEGYTGNEYTVLEERVTVGSQDKANEVIMDMLNMGYCVETHTDGASTYMIYSPNKFDYIKDRDGGISDYSVLEEIGTEAVWELDMKIDSAVSIAIALDDFYYDYDTYGYMDNLEIGEKRSDNVHKIEQDIYNGNIQGYLDEISSILANDNQLSNTQITAIKNIVDNIDKYIKEYFNNDEKNNEVKKSNINIEKN